jgi:dihydrofolate reductase (trimethoprim resistance protein)
MNEPTIPMFRRGDHVCKRSGSQWEGLVVGEYRTSLTPEGYAVESSTHKGSVQIYPAGALELVTVGKHNPSKDQ